MVLIKDRFETRGDNTEKFAVQISNAKSELFSSLELKGLLLISCANVGLYQIINLLWSVYAVRELGVAYSGVIWIGVVITRSVASYFTSRFSLSVQNSINMSLLVSLLLFFAIVSPTPLITLLFFVFMQFPRQIHNELAVLIPQDKVLNENIRSTFVSVVNGYQNYSSLAGLLVGYVLTEFLKFNVKEVWLFIAVAILIVSLIGQVWLRKADLTVSQS